MGSLFGRNNARSSLYHRSLAIPPTRGLDRKI